MQHNHVTSLLNESGYRICHFHRTEKKGGGVAIICKQQYRPKFEKSFEYTSFECIIQTIKTGNSGNLTFVVVYRHAGENLSTFLNEFHEFLEYVKINFKCFVVCGDFNIHVNKNTNPETVKFMEMLTIFSLQQLIQTSTHIHGNTLDLIIHDPDLINISDIIIDSADRPGSDHFLVNFNVMCNVESVEKREINYRDVKNVDMHEFLSDISIDTNRYITEADPNNFCSSIELFFDIYGNTVDRHAPVITKQVNTVTRPPWMDAEFVAARKNRRILYRKWKKHRTLENRAEFEQARADVNVLAYDKRCNFYQQTIRSATSSQRELSNICNNLLDSGKKSQLPFSEDYQLLAERFNNFFIDKIVNIRNNLNVNDISTDVNQDVNINLTQFSTFRTVTVEQIMKQIKSSKIKTAQNDPIPASLLKSSVEILVPTLLHLVNTSLSTGSMDGLKDSIVTPILKKSGLDPDTLSNYRPVCGGLYIDKLIQKNVLLQLNEHMDSNNLHIPFQSGYKPFHSCETVLLRVNNDILLALDSGYCVVEIILDLSAAFDTVDHDKLELVLYDEIGLRGTVFDWFKSFLSDRKQSTSVNGCTSSLVDMKYGVPQGSVLGPVLFNIYIRSFTNMMRNAGYDVHGYADDHQGYKAFRIEFQYQSLCHSLPNCLDLISNWMTSYFLKLNASKTNLLIFSPKNLCESIYIDTVYLGNNVFIPVTFDAMNLGFKLDSQLSCSPHINMVMSQSYKMISNIGSIRKYLTVSDIRYLVQSSIMSRLDFHNALLYGIPDYEIMKLQKVQNSCARLIYGRKKFDHVSDLFTELHWLPVKQRIVFKILLFVFKIFMNMTPLYISECVDVHDVSCRTLQEKRIYSAYGDRAFSNYAPKLWNALPETIRTIETVQTFKRHLKHHLFSNFEEYNNRVNRYRV